MNKGQWAAGGCRVRGIHCYVVDWSVVVRWLYFLTSVTQFLAGLFCRGGVQFCEKVEHITSKNLLLCSDGDYITPVSTKLSFTHWLLPITTHVEQFHKKSPHLNTLERFPMTNSFDILATYALSPRKSTPSPQPPTRDRLPKYGTKMAASATATRHSVISVIVWRRSMTSRT